MKGFIRKLNGHCGLIKALLRIRIRIVLRLRKLIRYIRQCCGSESGSGMEKNPDPESEVRDPG
jgi:hypothetical protein